LIVYDEKIEFLRKMKSRTNVNRISRKKKKEFPYAL
jgi:hypothetical protein